MSYLGETFSIGAALSWAIGVILFKKSGDTYSPLSLNIFKNSVGIILFLPTVYIVGETLVPDQPLRAWILLSVSGVIGITVADTMFFISLKKLGAGLTAVVDTSYTPIMLLLSWAFLGDPIGSSILLGGALIVAAMVIGSYTRPAPGMTRESTPIHP